MRNDEDRRGLRLTLLAGAVGGLAVVAAGLALPYAVGAGVPAEVRNADSGFAETYWHFYAASIFISQAAVAVVITLRVARNRPSLVLLGISFTAVIGVIGELSTFMVARCADLFGTSTSCTAVVRPALLAIDLNAVILRGLLVVVPVILMTRLLLRCSRRAPGGPAPLLLPAVLLIISAVVATAATALIWPIAAASWESWLSG